MNRKLVCFVVLAALSTPAFAGVVVDLVGYPSQSAITLWPLPYTDTSTAGGNPAPYSQPENNYGDYAEICRGCLAQSWTATASGPLTDIQIAIAGTPPVNFSLNLYDAGTSGWADISSGTYMPGVNVSTNLFSAALPAELPTTWDAYTEKGRAAAVMLFTFCGPDQVMVRKDHRYIFEVSSYFNPNGMMWFRNGPTGANYAGGQAFRLATPLNANPACDLTLAATYIPEPATMLLLGLGGLTILRRTRA